MDEKRLIQDENNRIIQLEENWVQERVWYVSMKVISIIDIKKHGKKYLYSKIEEVVRQIMFDEMDLFEDIVDDVFINIVIDFIVSSLKLN
jgi:hypothetical protein